MVEYIPFLKLAPQVMFAQHEPDTSDKNPSASHGYQAGEKLIEDPPAPAIITITSHITHISFGLSMS